MTLNTSEGSALLIILGIGAIVFSGVVAAIVFIIKSLIDSAKLNAAVNEERQQQMYSQNQYPNQPMYNQNGYQNQPMYNQNQYPNQNNNNNNNSNMQ